MRDYAKVAPQFWIGQTGKKIKQLGTEAQLIALYLITSPHATMLGIYYLPLVFMAHEIGIPFEKAVKTFYALCEVGFCSYDEKTEYVWVHEMAVYQVGEQLKPNDNRVKHINEAYQALPALPFLKDFYEKYHTTLFLDPVRENKNSSEAPSKGLPKGVDLQAVINFWIDMLILYKITTAFVSSISKRKHFLLYISFKLQFEFL